MIPLLSLPIKILSTSKKQFSTSWLAYISECLVRIWRHKNLAPNLALSEAGMVFT